MIKNFFKKLKKIYKWVRILWSDEDWEPEYLFRIMQYKISRMRNLMEKSENFINLKKITREMKVAEELLDRIGLSNFYFDQRQRVKNRYAKGQCECPEELSWKLVEDKYDKNGKILSYSMIFYTCDFCNKHQYLWTDYDKIKKKQDMDYLFNHLRKKVLNWWS